MFFKGLSGEFELQILHGGDWKDGIGHYKGHGWKFVYGYEKDKFGYFDLEDEIRKLGYVTWDKLWYRIGFSEEFREVEDDKGVMHMLENLVGTVPKCTVYVCGDKKQADVEVDGPVKVSVGEANIDGVEGNADVGEGRAGDVSEGRAGDADVGKAVAGDVSEGKPVVAESEYDKLSSEDDCLYNPTDEDTDVSLGELEFVFDEEYIQARKNKKIAKNVFDLVDKNDGFENDFDVGPVDVVSSEYAESDDDLVESESDKETMRPLSGKIMYNPKCNHQNMELVIGMQFRNGFQCKNALTTWAIENGRFIHFRSVTARKLIAKCEKPCPWYIYASVVGYDGSFVLKTLRSDHTCPRNMTNKLISSSWIAQRYLNVFRVRYHMSIKDLRADILNRFKTYVGKHRLYRAKKLAQEMVRGSVESHYASIRKYLAELRRVDKEGNYELLLGEDSVFKGLYIGISALSKAFKASCRPVIGLDGCHLKTYLKGMLLCAVGQDGNGGMFPIAWAVVEIEDEACWTWFLTRLLHDLQISDGAGWTFISDQQKGLLNAVKLLVPQSEHRNCARHVYMNWLKAGHKGIGLKFLFWKAMSSTYEGEFKMAIQEMKAESPAAAENFLARDISKFCKAFISTHPCSDVVDNNVNESFNGWIVNARGLHVIHMCEEIRKSLMVRQVEKYNEMIKVTDRLCPKVREKLEQRKAESVHCIPYPALGNKFEVHCDGDRFVVSLELRECTCRVWSLSGIPCTHAISAIHYRSLDPATYVSDYFTMSRYLAAYDFGIEPIRGHSMWPEVDVPIVKPPTIRRMPGRPKKKRIAAPEEKDDRTKRLSKVGIKMKCSNCGQDGHNKRSCPNSTVIRPDVEKRRVGRPSKAKTTAQNNPQAAQTSSTSRAPITFRERAAARKGIGVYTSLSTGNVYYHQSSMTQQRVVHLNRRASMRSSSTRQQNAQHEVPMTQESRSVNDGSS